VIEGAQRPRKCRGNQRRSRQIFLESELKGDLNGRQRFLKTYAENHRQDR
jgi:hypothetical protein